jgi:hypothetical protein
LQFARNECCRKCRAPRHDAPLCAHNMAKGKCSECRAVAVRDDRGICWNDQDHCDEQQQQTQAQKQSEAESAEHNTDPACSGMLAIPDTDTTNTPMPSTPPTPPTPVPVAQDAR